MPHSAPVAAIFGLTHNLTFYLKYLVKKKEKNIAFKGPLQALSAQHL